jgi:hypothetical protein
MCSVERIVFDTIMVLRTKALDTIFDWVLILNEYIDKTVVTFAQTNYLNHCVYKLLS